MDSPASPPPSTCDVVKKKIRDINVQIEDITLSMRNILSNPDRRKLDSRLETMRLKKERLRTMIAMAKLKKVQAELDIIIEGTSIEIDLIDLKRKSDEDLESIDKTRVKRTTVERSSGIRSPEPSTSKSQKNKKRQSFVNSPQFITKSEVRTQDKPRKEVRWESERAENKPVGTILHPNEMTGCRELDSVHERMTNTIFKEIMDNKLKYIKKEKKSVSSMDTLVI